MTERDERWRRIEQLCQAALDRPNDEREAFLREACGDDAALEREVEELLAQETSASGFLTASSEAVSAAVFQSAGSPLTGLRVKSLDVGPLLGVGGMGEVYRAHDPRLGRDVAIKVLRPEIANDPGRVARFRREAQILASLNHPNIATILGLEEDGGITLLVLELVEGPTLAERIANGPIPLAETLPIACQIAEALDAAHGCGIIHRDVKPANIKIRADGTVKVLDFGMAKVDHASSLSDSPNSLRDVSPILITEPNVVLGTAAYMAPEQARGGAVDKRVDIWAFGCVLYEMLTGRLAFSGDSVSDTLAAILREEPDFSVLSAMPPRIRRLIRHCLEKDVRRRLRDIGDAQTVLADASDIDDDDSLRQRGCVPQFALTIVAPRDVDLPHSARQGGAPLISPDSTTILCPPLLRRLDTIEADALSVPIIGNAFWSPDSKWIAYHDAEQLRRIRVAGGHAETIAEHKTPNRGGSWSEQGTILLAGDNLLAGESLLTVPADGGRLTPVHVPGLERRNPYQPDFVAGSNDFLFWVADDDSATGQVFMAALRGAVAANCTWLMENETAVRYTSAGGGGVVFTRKDNLYWQKLNPRLRTLGGDPLLIARGVASSPQFAQGAFSVSQAGLVAWRPGSCLVPRVTIFDRHGVPQATVGPPLSVVSLRLSPDGSRLMAECERGTHLLQPERRGSLNLGNEFYSSLWSPDGTQLISLSAQPDKRLVRRPAGATSPSERLDCDDPADIQMLGDLSTDGTTVLFTTQNHVVAALSLAAGASSSVRVLTKPGALCPRFSPDCRWIVYGLGGGGICAQPISGESGLREQLTDTGRFPVWRRDGREIIYLDQGALWSIGVSDYGERPVFSEPLRLFAVGPSPGFVARMNPLAITADGSRIYFPQVPEQPDSNLIHVSSALTTSSFY